MSDTDLDIPAMPADRVLRVAIDDGLAQMKLVGETAGGPIKTLKIPTSIRAASAGGIIDLSGEIIGMYETEEGQRFVCSDELPSEETRHPDFHVSQIDRVLIGHTLLEAGYTGVDRIELLTAMPVDEYFVAGQINRDRIRQKTENLLKSVRAIPEGSREMARIIDVKVGCQAIAAFFDIMFDDEGKVRPGNTPDAIAVVDIGGSTTDVAVVLRGKSIDQGSSGALRRGVLDVHAAFVAGLTKSFGFTPRLSQTAMNRAIRTGKVSLFREEHDVSKILKAAVDDVGGQIMRDVERKIGNAATMDGVVFVGGGAGLFAHVVKHWRGVAIPHDPEFANARGLLKYANSRS